MRMIVAAALALGVIGLSHAEDKKFGKLEGKWSYTAGMRDGDKVAKEALQGEVIFTKDQITVPSGGDKPFLMKYTLNMKVMPVAIDMEITDGPVTEGKALGIVEVDGDALKIAYAPVMDDKTMRPKKFESTKENGAFYFELKRVK